MFGVDVSNVKPSIWSALVVLGIVIIMVPLAKVAFNRFPVPGLTPLVNAI